MDYGLSAVKALIAQLQPSQEVVGRGGVLALGGLLFQRAWLQGILVGGLEEGCFWLDDGSGVLELVFLKGFQLQSWKPGMYVLVVGAYAFASNGVPILKVHKIVDLSSFPNREALWHLEVIEAYRLFYESLINKCS